MRKLSFLWLGMAWVFGAAEALHADQVVFGEIMYHPHGDKPEYLEVSNLTATPLDIADWRFTDGVDYAFPSFSTNSPALTFLKAFERIVVSAADEATTRAAYPIPAAVRVFGPWTGNLSDAGERVTLKDKNGATVCTVEYNDRGHWSPAADGAGHSLVLRNPNRGVDDWRNWTVSARPDGTPGFETVPAVETPVANPEINLSQGIILVDYGDAWRYEDQNRDLGTAWREPDYPDGSWRTGKGLFGFETAGLPAPGIQTPLADADQLTYYFRLKFNYSGAVAGATLTVDQILDDGAVYYLNGQPLGRTGMAAGDVGFTTPASRTVTDAVEELAVISMGNPPLVQGVNTLAVEVHQINNTSSDVVFGARVKITAPIQTQQGIVLNEVLPGPAGTGFVEFYNPGATTVNLKGHYLTDDAGNLKKFQIAANLFVPAGGLASVGFVESGLRTGNPVAIYLVAPDGTSVLNAIRFNFPGDGSSLGRRPPGSNSWFLFPEPTRNLPNTTQSAVAAAVRLNEVHFTNVSSVDWVELHNAGETALPMDQFFLSARRDFTDKVALSGVLAARGFASWDVGFPFAGRDVTLYLINSAGTVIDCRVFERPDYGDTLQAFPDGEREWYATADSTRDAPNSVVRNTDIVINEIMYDPPSEQVDGEFIELFNRGTAIVDVSGWRITDGVECVVPAGQRIAPGGFLVVAANAAHLRRVFPSIAVVGDWQGRLRNTGDLIRLLDHHGNLVDEVDYKPGGDWPALAKTGGSSMELLHPWMDNSLSSAWRDSDESGKAPFKTYTYTSTWQQLKTLGGPSDYKELHLHLVGDAHVALKNISLSKNGTGTNLIVRGTKLSTNSVSASGWLCQGTHWASYIAGDELHLVADGRGDNRANRAEIDATGLERNASYLLSFEARWISGNPRLIAQTWDHSIATSIRLEIPENLGTPGAPNSRLLSAPAPQVENLRHSPAVPRPTDNVKITAKVFSFDPLARVQVFHRPDNANANATWVSKPMYDDGANGGDALAGDGTFTAELTEYKAQGRGVQFYVQAETAGGQSSVLPRQAASKPALYAVDSQTVPRDLRTVRAVVSQYDVEAIGNGGGAKYNFKFPRLQNHYFNTTLIMDESDIYYGGEIRNSGSPWTRGGGLDRGKFKVPDDRAFRGHTKFTYDNDPGGGQMTRNRVTRQLLYLLGHAVNEHEFVRFYVNSSYYGVREDTEAIDNEFLDRNFRNGSSGDLYRIDDEWWFTDNWQQEPRDADWRYKNSENPGRYRTEWMKRTNEDEDDFSALINFFKTVSGAFTQSDIERLIDPHATLKMCAVRGYISDWDSFSLNRGKNGFFYRRSTDGLFQFFHWDSDLAFGDSSAALYSGAPGFGAYISKPYNKRVFFTYLVELIQNYAKDSPRVNAWFQAEEDASPSYGANAAFYRNWFNSRLRSCTNAMGANYTRALDISTNGGNPLTTTDDVLTLAGTSPFGVLRIVVEGHPEARFAWTSDIAWTISGIRLRRGENVLTVKGLDQWGKVLKQDALAVTKTGNAPPAVALKANPDSWRVHVQEALELDGRDSFDPDGGPVSFEWSVSPADLVTLKELAPGHVAATFARPGLYTFTLRVTDSEGGSAEITREAAVYGPTGFSPFNGTRLEAFWNLENVEYRNNYSPGAWLSLNDAPGELMLQVLDDVARPATAVGPTHPFLWRALPERTPWSLHTQVRLDSRQFGNFFTGLLVETVEPGSTNRYAFGLDNGKTLNVTRLAADGTATTLATAANLTKEATLRVRRDGSNLHFEQRLDEVWVSQLTFALGAEVVAAKGGLFLATSVAQAVKVGFDDALLVDESNSSELRENLRLSELMYNPIGGDDYEYVELLNIGVTPLDLTGARFTAGIVFTFSKTILPAGQRIVVVKDRTRFVERYGASGVLFADGVFSGKLDNGGETLTLVDGNENLIFSVAYEDGGEWPGRADGFGSSLELIDPRGGYDDPDNWRSSSEYLGSPGRAGVGPLHSVVINEVLTHTDAPLEDAIELFNPTSEAVDVSGWFLSDALDDLKRFRIPNGTVLPAQGYMVFYKVEFNLSNPLVPFSLSSARGDQVRLTAADAAGNVTFFVDDVDFGPSENAVSFGRYPNGVGPVAAMSQLSLGTDVLPTDPPARLADFRKGRGAVNPYPKVGPVVLNRIMYHPPVGSDEFLELLNIAAEPVSLFDPAAPTNSWTLSGAVEFVFPRGAVLAPGEKALVVAMAPAAFRLKYGLATTLQVFGPFVGSLDNAGESVELHKPDAPQTLPPNEGLVPYILVEKVRYDNRPPWPVLADGYGAALVRIDPAKYGNDPANWRAGDVVEKDTDRDGMPDSWELAYGFNLNVNTDAAQDSDGDGRSNLDEFISGTNPRDAQSYLRVEVAGVVGAAFTISFTAAAGRSYSVLYRDSLSEGSWERLADTPAQGAASVVQVADPTAVGKAGRFYRLITPALPGP
ncbi:MAG: lamin tail domain-containing protein [Verrucomicrobia bacterium]|nr:lamin tail domain-containing protein [Verrucomicrobiota bacterium]